MAPKETKHMILPLNRETSVFHKKYYLRAIFRSVALVFLVVGYSTYNYIYDVAPTNEKISIENHSLGKPESAFNLLKPNDVNDSFSYFDVSNGVRKLQTTNSTTLTLSEEDCGKAESWWELLLYIIGVLYLFLALAVVVDEFFVPALEEMSSERHLNLSMDVAGATLMAAGGSAPELFTSLFGTFAESDVGFGTIVGSAVFNVLFVIACVSLLSKEVLSLTWWPLFRDCTYYVISLIVLAIFVGVESPEQIFAWEAGVLLAMYFGYVIVMKFNGAIYFFLTKKNLDDMMEEATTPKSILMMSDRINDTDASVVSMHTMRSFAWPGTFRAGVLKLLRNPSSWVDSAGVGIVSQLTGDVNDTFESIDKDKDGHLSKEELSKLFFELDCPISAEELDDVMNTLDIDKDGKIDKWEFTKWYMKSEERIRGRVHAIFHLFDENHNGSISKAEIRNVLEKLEPSITDEDVHAAVNQMYQEGNKDEITFEEFSAWYQKSILYENHVKTVDNALDGVCSSLSPPTDEGLFAMITWLVTFPLVFTLTITIPDVRRPGMGKYCYISFLLAIAWVGGYSYFMVEFAEVIGKTVGIPDVIMGLTFLAAGTSVPDLLSSVIVARRGEGDMAVSSSIGSNIFDILVGLPFPWLCYTLWNNNKNFVKINASGVWVSIIILLVMVVLIIATIHFNGWKLTKRVAFIMFILYFAFVAQSIVQELPFEAVCT